MSSLHFIAHRKNAGKNFPRWVKKKFTYLTKITTIPDGAENKTTMQDANLKSAVQ